MVPQASVGTPTLFAHPLLETAPAAAPNEAAVEEVPVTEEVALEVPAQAPPEVELIIPPPPAGLEQRTQSRASRASSAMASTGTSHQALPAASENVSAARAHVEEPIEETEARVQGNLTAALGVQPAPSPEIEQLCDDIQDAIENKRPPDEASLRRADPEAEAQAVGDALNDDISGDGQRVAGEYDSVNAEATGTPEQISEALPETPPVGSTPNVAAANVTPPAATEAEVSLEADRAATADRIAEANIDNDVTREIPGPPFSDAREGMAELEQAAAEDPAAVLLEQEEAIAASRQGMRNVETQALAALEASRSTTVEGSLSQQLAMAGSEEEQRVAAAAAAEGIFTTAQEAVNGLLENMVPTAMGLWNTGKERTATAFDTELQRAKDMVDERHEGIGGAIVSIWDRGFGLPDRITRIYTSAERTFGRDICTLIREVSTYVNGIVIACEEIIDNADREIAALFTSLPENLQDWATEQQAGFETRLTGMRDNAHDAQQNFTDDLVTQAGAAVQEARERIDALREAAKGLIQKVADAIEAFIDDPVRAIINGLLTVVGIAPAAFWALIAQIEEVASDIADDPLNFANNLMDAVGLGFSNFFDGFFGHLLTGFINWLFSAMGTVGVEMPPDTSLKSIITFFLQLMGLTWPNIRKILVKHIGEENVELIEKAYELLTLLIEEGPAGIFEMIKERLDPTDMLNTIIEAAVSYMVETIVSVATVRILGLFNPAGAILQAMEAIYKVLKWIFENAARIFTLVQTIVQGVADLIAGNIAGMAKKTEEALAGMLVPVIDFIAGFLGLGDLPEKIAEVVGGFQELVLEAVDKAIGFLVERARGLLQALGLGGDAGAGEGGEDEEVGKSISFSADGEGHRTWIDDSGSAPRVMVASEAETLDAKVRRWNTEVHLPAHAANKEAIEGLLPTVNSLLGITKQEAAEAKTADVAEDRNSTPETQALAKQQDDEVEAKQDELVPLLRQLFELFREEIDLSIFDPVINRMAATAIADFRADLTGSADALAGETDWETVKQIVLGTSGGKTEALHRQPLGTSSFADFQRHTYDDLYEKAFEAALVTVAADAGGQTTEDYFPTAGRKKYLDNRRPVIHRTSGAPEGEQGSSGSGTASLAALQQYLFDRGRAATARTALGSYFEKSLVSKREHADYKPIVTDYAVTGGKIRFTYDYAEADEEGGADDFATEIGIGEIADLPVIVQSSSGSNVRLKETGTRGRTASSGTIRNDGGGVPLHSAHLIADLFTGSGYGGSGNLILTSPDYNTKDMWDREKSIRDTILAITPTPTQDESGELIVTKLAFNLTVTASLKALTDDPVVAELKQQVDTEIPKLTRKDIDNLAGETMRLLTGKRDLRISQRVTYAGGNEVVSFNIPVLGKDTDLDP